MASNPVTDISAEDPEGSAEQSAYMSVGDLIAQLSQYPQTKQVRIIMRDTSENEGIDEDNNYPIMYTEESVDTEPESPTKGEEFVAIVCDMREDEDDEDGHEADFKGE